MGPCSSILSFFTATCWDQWSIVCITVRAGIRNFHDVPFPETLAGHSAINIRFIISFHQFVNTDTSLVDPRGHVVCLSTGTCVFVHPSCGEYNSPKTSFARKVVLRENEQHHLDAYYMSTCSAQRFLTPHHSHTNSPVCSRSSCWD